jgi:alcohol dehydrogenase, propanol-preferring
MRAQLLQRIAPIEEGPLQYSSTDDPKIGPNDVLIKIKACGVCHSNLHMIEGEFRVFGAPAKLPIIPGHEIAGVVASAGSAVEKWHEGDRVGVQVLYEACGTCEFCLVGREQLCLNKKVTGETVDGGYAELIAAPSNFIYSIPDNIGDEEAAPLFCPGVTAYRAVRRAGVRMGHKVVVMGIGGVGHMSVQFAKLAGAEVIAVDKSLNAMSLARELGADVAIPPSELDQHLAKSGKPDVILVHTPAQAAIDQAFKSIKRGGVILMAVMGNVPIVFPEEYTVMTSVIGTRHDMLETLKIATLGKIKVKTKSFPLSDASAILEALKRGEITGRAVLVP